MLLQQQQGAQPSLLRADSQVELATDSSGKRGGGRVNHSAAVSIDHSEESGMADMHANDDDVEACREKKPAFSPSLSHRPVSPSLSQVSSSAAVVVLLSPLRHETSTSSKGHTRRGADSLKSDSDPVSQHIAIPSASPPRSPHNATTKTPPTRKAAAAAASPADSSRIRSNATWTLLHRSWMFCVMGLHRSWMFCVLGCVALWLAAAVALLLNAYWVLFIWGNGGTLALQWSRFDAYTALLLSTLFVCGLAIWALWAVWIGISVDAHAQATRALVQQAETHSIPVLSGDAAHQLHAIDALSLNHHHPQLQLRQLQRAVSGCGDDTLPILLSDWAARVCIYAVSGVTLIVLMPVLLAPTALIAIGIVIGLRSGARKLKWDAAAAAPTASPLPWVAVSRNDPRALRPRSPTSTSSSNASAHPSPQLSPIHKSALSPSNSPSTSTSRKSALIPSAAQSPSTSDRGLLRSTSTYDHSAARRELLDLVVSISAARDVLLSCAQGNDARECLWALFVSALERERKLNLDAEGETAGGFRLDLGVPVPRFIARKLKRSSSAASAAPPGAAAASAERSISAAAAADDDDAAVKSSSSVRLGHSSDVGSSSSGLFVVVPLLTRLDALGVCLLALVAALALALTHAGLISTEEAALALLCALQLSATAMVASTYTSTARLARSMSLFLRTIAISSPASYSSRSPSSSSENCRCCFPLRGSASSSSCGPTRVLSESACSSSVGCGSRQWVTDAEARVSIAFATRRHSVAIAATAAKAAAEAEAAASSSSPSDYTTDDDTLKFSPGLRDARTLRTLRTAALPCSGWSAPLIMHGWPMCGEVRLEGFSSAATSVSKLKLDEPVGLRDVSLTVSSGTRVAVLYLPSSTSGSSNSTGSASPCDTSRSSASRGASGGFLQVGSGLIGASLLRIIESAAGQITVDGIDISRIPLQQLRSSVSLVCARPALFRGSIRFNLDPLSEYSATTPGGDSPLQDQLVQETDESPAVLVNDTLQQERGRSNFNFESEHPRDGFDPSNSGPITDRRVNNVSSSSSGGGGGTAATDTADADFNLWTALRIAGGEELEGFIRALPDGLDTQVEVDHDNQVEVGATPKGARVRLTLEQRQGLSISRAALRGGRLVIVADDDEQTSSPSTLLRSTGSSSSNRCRCTPEEGASLTDRVCAALWSHHKLKSDRTPVVSRKLKLDRPTVISLVSPSLRGLRDAVVSDRVLVLGSSGSGASSSGASGDTGSGERAILLQYGSPLSLLRTTFAARTQPQVEVRSPSAARAQQQQPHVGNVIGGGRTIGAQRDLETNPQASIRNNDAGPQRLAAAAAAAASLSPIAVGTLGGCTDLRPVTFSSFVDAVAGVELRARAARAAAKL